jgi:aminoglycoside phosphotransferase (APT) family kinase protein
VGTMESEMEPTQLRFAKELQFGRIMLRRAKRELGRLDWEIQSATDRNLDTSILVEDFDQLRESIASFERELDTLQAQVANIQAGNALREPPVHVETPSV